MSRKSGFMSSNISDILSNNKKKNTPPASRKRKRDEDSDEDVRTTMQEIRDLVYNHQTKKTKRQLDQDKLKQLGAKLNDKHKMPYNMRMGIHKKREERETIVREKAREAGDYVPPKKKFRKGSLSDEEYLNQLKGNRRGDRHSVGDGSRGLKPAVGRFRDGILFLSKRDIDATATKKR